MAFDCCHPSGGNSKGAGVFPFLGPYFLINLPSVSTQPLSIWVNCFVHIPLKLATFFIAEIVICIYTLGLNSSSFLHYSSILNFLLVFNTLSFVSHPHFSHPFLTYPLVIHTLSSVSHPRFSHPFLTYPSVIHTLSFVSHPHFSHPLSTYLLVIHTLSFVSHPLFSHPLSTYTLVIHTLSLSLTILILIID